MIRPADLDSIKLVLEENFARDDSVEIAIERAVLQGASTWGVNLGDAVTLRLAQLLREALIGAEAADANFRLLKGAQLELGRIKKQRDELKEQVGDLNVALLQEKSKPSVDEN